MLFKVESGKSTFELNPELKAIDKFADLTDRQMTYVILSTDYKSPFRKLSSDERKYHSAITAGYKLEKDGKRLDVNARNVIAGKDGRIEAAVKYYKELQKDEDYETLLSISVLIAQIRELNAKPEKNFQELAATVNLNVDKLDKLMATKKRLEELLDQREDAPAPDNITTDEDSVAVSQLSVLAKLNEGML